MKVFLSTLGIGVLVVVVGMVGWSLRAYAPGEETVTAEVTVRMEKVVHLLSAYNDGTESTDLFFDVFVDRSDLGLTELDTSEGEVYYSDLPLAQQIDFMEVKTDPDADSGTTCQSNTSPHRCEVEGAGTYTLDITFRDGAWAVTTVEVPEPPLLERPTVLFPDALPEQGDPLRVVFRDTGATTYNASVSLCRAYGNDGINPCLDGQDFSLFLDDGGSWVLEWPSEGASLTVDAIEKTVTLTSDLLLTFEVSVQVRVCGELTGERDDGVLTYVEACTFVEFVR